MTVRTILRRKGTDIYTVPSDAPLAEAASRLRRHDVGALLILDDAAPVGIVSERDIVWAVSEHGQAALDRPVWSEMSAPVETCSPDDEVREVMERMTDRRIRHLPVVDRGRVVGVVSIGDVVKHRVLEVQHEAAVLQDALTLRWASSAAA